MSDHMAGGNPGSIWFLLSRILQGPVLGSLAGSGIWGDVYLSPQAGAIRFVFFGRKLNPWPLAALEWKILVQLS